MKGRKEETGDAFLDGDARGSFDERVFSHQVFVFKNNIMIKGETFDGIDE